MTKSLTPDNLQETATSYRDLGTLLTSRVLQLQNELGGLSAAGAPLSDINDKRNEIDATSSQINACFTKAIDFDTKAALKILTETDVADAMIALQCVTVKVKLAVNKLNEIRSALRFVAVFIDIGSAIATLFMPKGITAANIKVLIERIEILSKTEDGGLSAAEKDEMLKICLPAGDGG